MFVVKTKQTEIKLTVQIQGIKVKSKSSPPYFSDNPTVILPGVNFLVLLFINSLCIYECGSMRIDLVFIKPFV